MNFLLFYIGTEKQENISGKRAENANMSQLDFIAHMEQISRVIVTISGLILVIFS